MPKYEVVAIWTRTFTKTIEVEAPSEDAAQERVETSLKASLAAGSEDQSAWDFESVDLEIESVDEVESPGESESESGEAP